MRFMLFVYPGEQNLRDSDPEIALEVVKAMNAYNEELTRAGVLLALDGLHPPDEGAHVTFQGSGERPSVVDGPFTEAKELVGGYWIIQARSKEEAVEWASRAPIGRGTIEVRQIADPGDYGPEIDEASRLSQDPPQQPTEG